MGSQLSYRMIDPVSINMDHAGARRGRSRRCGRRRGQLDLRRPVLHPKPGAHSRLSLEKPVARRRGVRSSDNQLVALDIETRARSRPGVGIVHRRRARLHDERPQLSKVVTPIVKIGEAIFPGSRFTIVWFTSVY
jgi:hypothetical protein